MVGRNLLETYRVTRRMRLTRYGKGEAGGGKTSAAVLP